MTKRLADATTADYEAVREEMGAIGRCACVQEAAQLFVEVIHERFRSSLVLLRLFLTVRYDELPDEDRRFVDGRGRDTGTSPLFRGAMPVFTLFGTRGTRPEWTDRRTSSHFRCIPLASTAFVASLSMLSRQFESMGLDLGLIDTWETTIVAAGRADQFRGMLYIRDAASGRDSQGRMIVPKQDFVASSGVRTTLGFGSGYAGHSTLATLFAFTGETVERPVVEPLAHLLDAFIASTEALVGHGRFFAGR